MVLPYLTVATVGFLLLPESCTSRRHIPIPANQITDTDRGTVPRALRDNKSEANDGRDNFHLTAAASRLLQEAEEGWQSNNIDEEVDDGNNGDAQNSSSKPPKYNVYSLPTFEIQLDIDLWTTAVNAQFLNHRHLSLERGPREEPREEKQKQKQKQQQQQQQQQHDVQKHYIRHLQSDKNDDEDPLLSLQALKNALQLTPANYNGLATTATLGEQIREFLIDATIDYVLRFSHEMLRTRERIDKGWDVVHALDLRGEVLDVEFKEEETYFLGGSGGKDAVGNGGFRSLQNYEDNTHDNYDVQRGRRAAQSSETFATLTLSFTGTAAILQGQSTASSLLQFSSPSDLSLYRRPDIGRDELRLLLRGSFAPPDGPYRFLSLLLESSSQSSQPLSLRQIERMTHRERMAYDAALVLGGTRQVKARTDLDLFPQADFLGMEDANPSDASTVLGNGSGNGNGPMMLDPKAEKRESITVFLQGAYLVLFIGGFYVYASYNFRRMHLKRELEKYHHRNDVGTVLVKDGELNDSGLFALSSMQKAKLFRRRKGKFMVIRATRFGRLGRLGKWIRSGSGKRGKGSPSVTVGYDDGEDGFFELELSGIESSDEGDSSGEDLSSVDYGDESGDNMEKGLRESYAESVRFKKGLDMNPIDAENHGRHVESPGSNTMKPVDDEIIMTEQSSTPPTGAWGDVLDDVVPIPANDGVKGMDDGDGKYQHGGSNGEVIVQRRYVQPASPFDVLYGAAFLHGEADRVEAMRRYKKSKQRIRASPSARRRKKKKKASTMKVIMDAMNGQKSKDAIKPMMTISEVEDAASAAKELFAEEDEDDYDSDDKEEADEVEESDDLEKVDHGEARNNNPSQSSFYAPSNFLRNLSEKYKLGLFENEDSIKAQDGISGQSATDEPPKHEEEFPVEEGVVFKDFPRQDGTPCLIYNVADDAKPQTSGSDDFATLQQTVEYIEPIAEDEDSIFEEEANQEESANNQSIAPESAEPTDDFSTKLNRILTSKTNQIEERKQMEREMEGMRKEREERKRLAAQTAGSAEEQTVSMGDST